MKFENPMMAISMFEVENIVTTASGQGGQGGQEPEKLDANAIALGTLNGQTYTVVF